MDEEDHPTGVILNDCIEHGTFLHDALPICLVLTLNQVKVGLQKTNSWPLHARVCHRRPTTVLPPTQNTRQSSPHHHIPPIYGARVKFAEPEDDTPILPEERLKFFQQVVGVFLYYAIAIDNTVLVALSDIGLEQARATSKTMDEVQQLLNSKTTGNHTHTTISHQHMAPEYNLQNQRTIHRSFQKKDSNLSSK